MSVTTRGGQHHHWVTPFLEALSDLSLSVLPSKVEVIRSYYYRHEQQLSNTGAKTVKSNELKNQILDELTADIERDRLIVWMILGRKFCLRWMVVVMVPLRISS